MAVWLQVQGGSIELDETFNKVRARCEAAMKLKIDYENGALDDDTKFDPFHQLSFATADGGRFSASVEKVIGITSDTATDKE